MTDPGAPPAFTGRTTLTPEDGAVLIRASRTWVGYFNQSRLLIWCAMISLGSSAEAIIDNHTGSSVLLGVGIVIFVLALIVGSRTARWMGASYGRGQERELVLDGEGISIREPGKTIWEAWSVFDRAYEAPKHFVFFSGPGVLVVPKRAFGPNVLEAVRALVASKVALRALR